MNGRSGTMTSSAAKVRGNTNARTWKIPLTICVSLGDGEMSEEKAATSEGLALIEAMRIPVIQDDLESRTGYQPTFLDLDDDEIAAAHRAPR